MATKHADNKENLYMDSLEKRLEKSRNDIEALIHKAIMLYEPYHDSDQAEVILKKIIDQYPQNVDARMWRAEFLCFWHASYEDAEPHLRAALAINPNRADCHAVLGGVLETMRSRMPEAEFHYRKAFEIEPTWIGPRVFCANILFERGDFQGARHELKEALKYVIDGKWPTSNPVEEYYENMITGRLYIDRRQEILDFIQKIDVAEAAAKMEPEES